MEGKTWEMDMRKAIDWLRCGAVTLTLTLLASCASIGGTDSTASPTDPDETRRAQALFASRWDDVLRMRPEYATYTGNHRFGHLLTDASPDGIAAYDAWWRATQQRARDVDRRRLSANDRVSIELLQHEADEEVLMQQFDGFRTMTVSAAPFSFQGRFARLLNVSPVASKPQVEQLLARIEAYPRRIDQEIARLRSGMAAGWVAPRPALEHAISQLDGQLANAAEQSPFFEPFRRLGNEIAADDREALRRRGLRAIEQQVMPATRRLRDFVAGEYLAAAPSDGALLRYSGGERVYAALVRSHTTTWLTPQQIHQIGLQHVARLATEMQAIMRSTGFTGDFAAFLRFLNTDPQFFHESGEALLAGYRDIAKRIEPELPRLFAELPRAPYGVRALPSFMGAGATATYTEPTLDGTRPGWFNANALAFKRSPKWGMETLVAHEAVPGHHLQAARAVELQGLPMFRRDAGFTAFNEGWALYAETLGSELGLYTDPYSRFGHLRMQMFRAARLVVDTGIHALGWDRQQAIEYLKERTGFEAGFVTAEVDRYYSWPGQALGYMIGQLKIIELRERAKAALGERFDIRRFHMVVLDSGQLTLQILERQVDEWVASMKAVPARE